MRSNIHLVAHFAVPWLIALIFFRGQWKRAMLVMWFTMLVDLDHLLADPVYDSGRCSIGFHALHSFYLIPIYIVLVFWRPTRWLGIGLSVHMALDGIDCGLMA